MRAAVRRVLAIATAGVMLWGPMLLALIGLVPTGGQLPAGHLLAASAQTIIAVRVLYVLFVIEPAPAAPGRYRIIPRYPEGPLLLAALGLATGLGGFWEATGGGSPLAAALAVPGSALLLFAATHLRRRPLWGGFITVGDGLLRLEFPGGSYSVPAGQILHIYRQARDGSFYIVTPWPERNILVLTRAARGSYWVDGAERLLDVLGDGPPIEEVDSLLRAIRQAR